LRDTSSSPQPGFLRRLHRRRWLFYVMIDPCESGRGMRRARRYVSNPIRSKRNLHHPFAIADAPGRRGVAPAILPLTNHPESLRRISVVFYAMHSAASDIGGGHAVTSGPRAFLPTDLGLRLTGGPLFPTKPDCAESARLSIGSSPLPSSPAFRGAVVPSPDKRPWPLPPSGGRFLFFAPAVHIIIFPARPSAAAGTCKSHEPILPISVQTGAWRQSDQRLSLAGQQLDVLRGRWQIRRNRSWCRGS
jgi:hypothetical protein